MTGLYRVNVQGGGSFLYDAIDVGRFALRMAEEGDRRPFTVELETGPFCLVCNDKGGPGPLDPCPECNRYGELSDMRPEILCPRCDLVFDLPERDADAVDLVIGAEAVHVVVEDGRAVSVWAHAEHVRAYAEKREGEGILMQVIEGVDVQQSARGEDST